MKKSTLSSLFAFKCSVSFAQESAYTAQADIPYYDLSEQEAPSRYSPISCGALQPVALLQDFIDILDVQFLRVEVIAKPIKQFAIFLG